MGRPLPIACTLGAADLAVRGEEIRALGRDGLLDVALEQDGRAVLRLRGDPAIRERVEALVAAERECCAFLDFRVEHGPDAIVLSISAPADGAEMLHEFALTFAGR